MEQEQVKEERKFSQAEVDALVQKRLVKEQRRVERNLREQLARQAASVEPKREEFRDDDAYLQAQIEHLAEQKAAEKFAERERQQQQERISETFREKADKAAERFPDFDAVISNPLLPINDGMAEFIADSDLGPDLAYHLGKNPHKAAQIAQMSPIKAARELTRIEAELASKPPPRTSAAPAPITPIGASKASSKSLEDMSFDEFAARRRQQIKNRR